MYCIHCRGPLTSADRRCGRCGARTRPLPIRTLLRVALTAALLTSTVLAAGRLWAAAEDQGRVEDARRVIPDEPKRDRLDPTPVAPEPTPNASDGAGGGAPVTSATAPAAEPQPVKAVAAIASATAPPAVTGCNRPVSYEPALVVDGDPTTAWRVPGDGIGQRVQVTLERPTRLLQVGLLPGYARVDPCTKVDRFVQMRRVTQVRWIFDGGAAIRQSFEDRPAIQSIAVDVVTKTITVEVVATTADPELDFTPISEIRLGGLAA